MSKSETYLGWKVDFSSPAGEAPLVSPGSLSWQVFKNPLALGIGGICAVMLEFADPRIRSGVWDHSLFKTDPVGRSKRTGTAALLGTFGPASAARRVIHGISNMHSRVKGETPDGEPYHALDPELLTWVSATATYGFVTAYHRFIRKLTPAEIDQYFVESGTTARLFGVPSPVRSMAEFHEMLESLLPRFEPHPINTEFLDIMKSGRADPDIPRGLQSAVANAAVAILPKSVRDRLELGKDYDLSPLGLMTIKTLAAVVERTPDQNSPAAQASVRLGLPRSFPWKSARERRRLLENTEWAMSETDVPSPAH